MNVVFTKIYRCTDENLLAYEMAVSLCNHKDIGTRDIAVSRAKFIKDFALDMFPDGYEASNCYHLSKIKPESREYYQALLDLLNWQTSWQLESFWDWYEKQNSLSKMLLKAFNPLVVHGLNFVMNMNCTVEEWRYALKIASTIDLYRLAGQNVIVEMSNKTYTIKAF